MIKKGDEINLIKEKIKFFFSNKITIHISLKNDYWYNGDILEISKEYFLFNDKKMGKRLIFYTELKDEGISEYITKSTMKKWKK